MDIPECLFSAQDPCFTPLGPAQKRQHVRTCWGTAAAPPLPLPFSVCQSSALAPRSPDVQRAEEQGTGIPIPLHRSLWPRTKGSCHSNHSLAPTSLRNKYEWIHRKSHGPLLYRHWELRTELRPPPQSPFSPLKAIPSTDRRPRL